MKNYLNIWIVFLLSRYSKKVKEAKNEEQESYLINNNLISEIKINYKYKQIKKIRH